MLMAWQSRRSHRTRDKASREAPQATKHPDPPDSVARPIAKSFFDIPREVRDRIYELVLSSYPRQRYKFSTDVSFQDGLLGQLFLRFEDGVSIGNVERSTRKTPAQSPTSEVASPTDEHERSARLQYMWYFGYGLHGEGDDGELDDALNELLGLNKYWISEAEMKEWDHDQLWETPDWVHPKIHPRFDAELLRRAHFFAGQDLVSLHLYRPAALRDGRSNIRDTVVQFFLQQIMASPFLLHHCSVKSNEETGLTLLYSGDSQDAASARITHGEPSRCCPFRSPPPKRAKREMLDEPKIWPVTRDSDIKATHRTGRHGRSSTVPVRRLDGTVKMIVTDTTDLHLNKLWDFELKFDEADRKMKDHTDIGKAGVAFWLNMRDGDPDDLLSPLEL